MGLESYLLSVVFEKPVPPAEELVRFLQKAGAYFLAENSSIIETNDFRNFYFEIRSPLGLTEINALLSPGENGVKYLSVRFSVLSPSSVIEQTFTFLNALALLKPIRVLETDNKNKELRLDPAEFRLNKPKVRKRQIVIDNVTGLIIEGGMPTSNFIVEHNMIKRMYSSDKEPHPNWFRKFYGFFFIRRQPPK